MMASTWPSRSYLIAVSAKLAFAGLSSPRYLGHPNTFVVRLVSISAWLGGGLEHAGQLEPVIERSTSVSIVLGDLPDAVLLIKLGALLIVALGLTNIASNFVEGRITRSGDLTPSIQVLLVKIFG